MLDIRKISALCPQYHSDKKIIGIGIKNIVTRPAPNIQKLANLKLEIDFKYENIYLNFDKKDAILALAFIFAKARMTFIHDAINDIYLNGELLDKFEYNDNITTIDTDKTIVEFNIKDILDSGLIKEKNTIIVEEENIFTHLCFAFVYPIYLNQGETTDTMIKMLIEDWKIKPQSI